MVSFLFLEKVIGNQFFILKEEGCYKSKLTEKGG
jgi:hypothetical protein